MKILAVKFFWHRSKSIFHLENWTPELTGSGLTGIITLGQPGEALKIFEFFARYFCFEMRAKTEKLCYKEPRVSWVTPKMSQNFDLMYFNKIEKSYLFANNE